MFFERNAQVRMLVLITLSCSLLASCGGEDDEENGEGVEGRNDEAYQLSVAGSGSLQNAAWSPDGDMIVLTNFKEGYNEPPADLLIYTLETEDTRTLISDGSANVNLPGSAWSASAEAITFSSDRDPHDEIYMIDDGGTTGDEEPVTSREDYMAYEPSFSPDGLQIVFESHPLDVEDNGVITVVNSDGSGDYVAVTGTDDDCRQPNWSPAGDRILYQRKDGGQWDIWVVSPDGTAPQQVTSGSGDKTDASFSPDGEWIVYSSDENELDLANIFIIPTAGGSSIRVTNWDGYDGAPSWSPDGSTIVFESYPGDPDDCPGTTLWAVDAPNQ